MVSAVFHSTRDRTVELLPTAPAVAEKPRLVKPTPVAITRQPYDWRDLWMRALPSLLGIALQVGLWVS